MHDLFRSEPESLSVESANEMLSERREDAAWLSKLEHVEYSVKSDRLKSFDLWDAPGIGGERRERATGQSFY